MTPHDYEIITIHVPSMNLMDISNEQEEWNPDNLTSRSKGNKAIMQLLQNLYTQI